MKLITHKNVGKNDLTQMMGAINHENNKSVISQKGFCLAEEIFHNLNQGSLFEIYRIMDQLKDKDEVSILAKAFLERYHFDFRKYI